MNNKEATRLFLKREGNELSGRKNWIFWLLAGIFLMAIMAIGFGRASLSYLSYKMNDPFINWVDIVANQTTSSQSDGNERIDLKEYLFEETQNRSRFHFEDPRPNYLNYQYFRQIKTGKNIQADGRSIFASSRILEKILDDENVVCNRNGFPLTDVEIGFILTEELVHKLGYTSMPAFVTISQPYDTSLCKEVGLGLGINGYYDVQVPVVAVVKQLPGMMEFLFTDRYAHEIFGREDDALNILSNENNGELLLCGEWEQVNAVMKQLEANDDYECTLDTYQCSWQELQCLHICFSGYDDNLVLRYNELCKSLELGDVVRIYNFQPANYSEIAPSNYSVQMTDLDSVRAFKDDLYKRTGFKLEMTNIEAKENFRFVQRMGVVLSSVVIFIVVAFILVFISFLLRSHFQKIKRNLGTFKAFGIDNGTLNRIYIRLLVRLTVKAFACAFVAGAVLDLVIRLISNIEASFPWIDVFVGWNAVLFLLAVAAAVLATLFVSHSMLRNTPGDLIYDRK